MNPYSIYLDNNDIYNVTYVAHKQDANGHFIKTAFFTEKKYGSPEAARKAASKQIKAWENEAN